MVHQQTYCYIYFFFKKKAREIESMQSEGKADIWMHRNIAINLIIHSARALKHGFTVQGEKGKGKFSPPD